MSPEPTCQFSLRIEAVDGPLGGAEAVEELAADLRAELADVPVVRVDQLPVGAAPEGARGIELLLAAEFLMTAVQTAAALPDVIAAIRRSLARFAQRRQRVAVTVAGVELDPVRATDGQVRALVDRLLRLPTEAVAGARKALVVANARYDDPRLAQLRSPGLDAEALTGVLGDPAIGGFGVDLLMDADERTIRRRVAAFFADRDRDDVLLLHFSCHGVKDARGRLHLAARDTDLSVLGATAIPASFVNDQLSETQSRRVVLILDCCYSGAFVRGSQVRAGNEVSIADEFGAGSGRIVLTASSATEYAFEGGELAHAEARPSAFTSALVGGLQTGEADLDADGEISIDELYDYTYRTVRETTPGQAPMKWSFGVEGNLVVARSVRPAALPSWITEDLLSDRVVLRLEAVRELTEIVRTGRPGLRASAMATLAQLRDQDDSVRVQRAAAAALGASATATGPTSPAAPAPAAGGTALGAAVTPAPTAGTATAPAVAPTGVPAPPADAPAAATATDAPVTPPVVAPHPTAPAAEPGSAPAAESSPATPAADIAAAKQAARPAAPPKPPQPPPPAEPAVATAAAPAGAARRPAPAAPVPAAPDHPWSPLLIASGALVVLSLLLYAIGAGSVGLDWWTANLAWVPELVAVGLLLYTRRALWSGFLAGLLAWEWLYPAVIWEGDSDIGDWPGIFGAGNVVALAALGCTVALVVRDRPAFRDVSRRRIAIVAAIAVASLAATLLAAGLLDELLDMYGDSADLLLIAGAVLCAAAIPAVSLTAPASAAARLAAVGWLTGGAYTALAETVELDLDFDDYGAPVMLLWIMLVVTAAAAFATNLPPRPAGPAQPSGATRGGRGSAGTTTGTTAGTPPVPPPWSDASYLPGLTAIRYSRDGTLLLTGAALTVLSLLLYALAVAIVDPHFWAYAVSDDWARGHGIAWTVGLVALVLLLATANIRWGGLLAGLLSWEWLYLGLITKSDLHELFDAWSVLYYVANLTALAAFGCLLVAMTRDRQPATGPRWARLAFPAVVALLAAGTTLVAAALLGEIVFGDEDSIGLALVALACAATLPIVAGATPSGPTAPYISVGWLIGGAQYAVNETIVLHDHWSYTTELVALWLLLALTAAAMLGAVRWGRSIGLGAVHGDTASARGDEL